MHATAVQLRAVLAQAVALLLRAFNPVWNGSRRFAYEVSARRQIRGTIAANVRFLGFVSVRGTGSVHIGAGSQIGRHVTFETGEKGRIEIGQYVTLSEGSLVSALELVRLGDHASFGERVSIRDADHLTSRGQLIRVQGFEARPVIIERDVWVGRGACVLKGVTLSEGAVVGANSVVTRNVEPYVIVAGTPARPIGVRQP